MFDTGTIKLADFGLSKSLPVNKHAGYDLDSKFKLTGETGSYRYMAPEVFRHEPYNFKARQTPAVSHDPAPLHACMPVYHPACAAVLSHYAGDQA